MTRPNLGEATRAWARIGAESFGGPAAQIAVMHRVVVEERGWVDEARFLHALNYAMLLPGPEAQQLVTWLGWSQHGLRGGLIAGGLFILPGFLSILALSYAYVGFGHTVVGAAALLGIKAAVLAVVAEAVQRIGKRVLHGPAMVALAVAAAVAIGLLGVPYPLVVLGAAAIGLVGDRLSPGTFDAIRLREVTGHLDVTPSVARTLTTLAIGLALWLGPLVALRAALGPDHVLVDLGAFFSGAAVVTFGGAYAVLGYVAQQAVGVHGWLTGAEMLDGLGMAETTPGPLIQVVQFVGFLATWRDPGALPPWAAAAVGSVWVTWVTYAPSFLWVLAGAPWVDRLRGVAWLTHALSAITAAVVGVIAQLGLWLAAQVLFQTHADWHGWRAPVLTSLDPLATALALVSGWALLWRHVALWKVLLGAALVGAAARGGLGL